MALPEIVATPSTTPPAVPSVQVALEITPICVDELTALQRQRLDTAVMMLVNHLVSVSTGK